MQFLIENFEYIVISGIIVLTILVVVSIRYNFFLAKFFSNKKFRVNSNYDYEPTNSSKTFSLHIFNNNVNDSRVISFGYIYKNHNIDYYKSYLMKSNLPESSKVIIPSRDCIDCKIDAMKLKTIISDMNKGKRKVTKIQSFVSDSSGLTFKSKAKNVQKQLVNMLNIDYRDEQEKKRILRQKMIEEQKEIRSKKRIDRKLRRKEIIEKYRLKLRSMFKQKK